MDLGLQGRRAAVAASSGGLGFGVAAALAAEGAEVVVNGRDAAKLAAAAARIGACPVPGDVGTVAGSLAFVGAAREALGGIDVLVTNAGGPPPGSFLDVDDIDSYRRALELSCLSVIAMGNATVPEMRARRWGRVVAITSIAVRQPIPGLMLSNTARAGATGYLKTLSREVAPDGVTVNSLLPGTHATDRMRVLYGADTSGAAAAIPTGTVGDPADFGAVAAFLCSDQARFVTGAAIPVDGGANRALL